jgi:hypothetical protein
MKTQIMKLGFGLAAAGLLLMSGAGANAQSRPPRVQTTKGRICGDPTVRCRTSVPFDDWTLPFEVPKNGVIWESERFYVIMLESVPAGIDCSKFIPETDRTTVQAKFPKNKVFTSRCDDPTNLYYSNTDRNQMFMAIFAGRTRAEADRLLLKIKADGGYPGANIRRMTTGFNGT